MTFLRYRWLVHLYHWATFFRQKPWTFLFGVLLFPYNLISGYFKYPLDMHSEVVLKSIEALRAYWSLEGALQPPAWLRRRFLALELELSR